MPWKQVELVMQRQELIEALLRPGANIQQICKKYNISRKTAYKWLNRYEVEGLNGLRDKSKAPQTHPNQTPREMEEEIIQTHKDYPYWGPRKLKHYLQNEIPGCVWPAVSTFSRILKEAGCEVIKNTKSAPAKKRFERSQANELWQMDFKGSFMTRLHRCYPLTIIDDYSRYSIGLKACENEQKQTVKTHLIACFKNYGLPEQINVDNGNPWGHSDLESYTSLGIWLMKQGIRLSHSAPYHPQTNGKDERFHRTLKLEVLHNRRYEQCAEVQDVFDSWRHIYNYKRPHDALGGQPPSHRYVESSRSYTDKPIKIHYEADEKVRRVQSNGSIRFKGQRFRIGKALHGEDVAIRETEKDGEFSIFFIDLFIKKISTKPN